MQLKGQVPWGEEEARRSPGSTSVSGIFPDRIPAATQVCPLPVPPVFPEHPLGWTLASGGGEPAALPALNGMS